MTPTAATWAAALASVLLVGGASLAGAAALAVGQARLPRLIRLLVAFAAGGLLGGAFFHLLPEAGEQLGGPAATGLPTVAGILIFFVLEKIVRWRHCHADDAAGCTPHAKALTTMNLIGDGFHNLLDGVVIGAAYLADVRTGVAATLAVLLHEIPQEIGDFGVLLHGGLTVRRALTLNALSALVAVFGTAASLIVGTALAGSTTVLLPVAAGGFLYIAGSDLVPELHEELDVRVSLQQLAAMLLGLGLLWGLAGL